MRIAIPTTDKITVSNSPGDSEFFKVITYKREELIDEEFRPNPLKGNIRGSSISRSQADRLVSMLADCDILISGTSENELTRCEVRNFIKTVITRESLLTRAAGSYYRAYLRHERNSCCSP